jgi:hypothetical protein
MWKHLTVEGDDKAVFQSYKCFTNINKKKIPAKRSIDMDMSYTSVLHPKVAHSVSHKLHHAFYVTRPLLCARKRVAGNCRTVEINHCSFRRVRFALLYIVTRSKIV